MASRSGASALVTLPRAPGVAHPPLRGGVHKHQHLIYGTLIRSPTKRGTMSYTSITTTRPGPRMQAAETSEEGDALLAEIFGILAANGGESVLAGQDFARGISVAITKYEDSAAAVKTQIEIGAKGLLEFISAGPFVALDEWWPIASAALNDN